MRNRHAVALSLTLGLAVCTTGCTTGEEELGLPDDDLAEAATADGEAGGPLVAEAASNTTECRRNAALCGLASVGGALACTATILSGGTNFRADLGCASVVLGGGGNACAAANEYCGFGTISNSSTPSAYVGSDSSISRTETLTCGNVSGGTPRDRVRRAFFWVEDDTFGTVDVISKMQFVCTGGQTLTFGTNAGDRGKLSLNTCDAGHLVQGIEVYEGLVIDKARVRCDNVTTSSSSDTLGAWQGGSGGTADTAACAEGKYMFGAMVNYRNTAAGEVIAGFHLLCRY